MYSCGSMGDARKRLNTWKLSAGRQTPRLISGVGGTTDSGKEVSFKGNANLGQGSQSSTAKL